MADLLVAILVTSTVPDIDPSSPMDRVLTDEARTHIMRTYRGLLAAPNSPVEETEIADDLPLTARRSREADASD